MKIRQGFVSNSSTSSFVLVGFDATGLFEDSEELQEKSELMEFDYLIGDEGGCPEGMEYVVGMYLSYWSSEDYGINVKPIDLIGLRNNIMDLRDKLGAKTRIILCEGIQMS